MHDEYGSETLMACLGRNETDTGRREEKRRGEEEKRTVKFLYLFSTVCLYVFFALLPPFFLSPSLFNSVPL